MAEPRPLAATQGEEDGPPAVSVIVPAYNSAATIGRTLEALVRQDLDRPYEVIVVDDGSDDETVAIAERAPGKVTVLRQDHGGPGPARNLGARHARGAVLAFTDSDCFPTERWLHEGLAALQHAELVQGAVIADPGVPRGPYDRSIWVKRESGLYETANLFIRRELFERLGGFEDWLPARIGGPLAEDVWLGWRVRRSGARTIFSERALVHHAVLDRGVRGYLAAQLRLIYFPAMVAKVPELRRTYLYARLFFLPRTAAFDAGLGGAVLALALGSPLPLAAFAPYLWLSGRRALGWGRHAPAVIASSLAADLIGFLSLVWGSLRWRTAVL